MVYPSRHRPFALAIGVILAIVMVIGAVWLLVRDGGPVASPGEPLASTAVPVPAEPGEPSVPRPVYSFDGDVAAFYEWLQLTPPTTTMPTLTEARRVAQDFLHRVAAMPRPAYVSARWRSDFIATVDFRSSVRGANTARGPVTTVVLGKGRTTFTVLGTTTPTIRVVAPRSVITPSDLQVVTPPVTVVGTALAFEAT